MIGLLVLSDGRPYLHETIESARTHLGGYDDFVERVLVDDSMSPTWGKTLNDRYGDEFHIVHGAAKLGFAGAIRAGWEALRAEFTFHLEDDFRFEHDIDTDAMIAVLDENQHLAQASLQRNPVNKRERRVGVFDAWGTFSQHHTDGIAWLEHQCWFTTNPCVYPSWVRERPWPSVPDNERVFGEALFTEGYCSAVMGTVHDPPAVTHAGAHRSEGWQP